MFPLSQTKLRVATNTASQLIGKFFSAGTMVLVSILLARRFGAEGYGDFTKITTFVAFFFLLADFGLNAVYLQNRHDTNTWTSLLGLRLVGSTALTFVAVSILAFLPQGIAQGYTGLVRLGIIVFAPAIIFQALITSANAVFQERLRYDYATVAISIGSLVTLLFVWVLTRVDGANVLLAVVALLVGSGATALVGLWLVRPLVPTFGLTFSASAFRSLFLPALPLGLTLLFNLVYFRIDSVILTLTRSTAEVGLYGLAYKIFEVPLVIPTFFMNAVYPLLLKSKANSQQSAVPAKSREAGSGSTGQDPAVRDKNQKFQNIILKSGIFLLLTSLVLLLVFWAAAPLLVFIQSDFTASVPALRVLSLGFPFFFLSSLAMWALIAQKQQGLLAVVYGASMLVNVLLNSIYTSAYGYMAAAWITVVSEALVLFLTGGVLLRVLSKR